MLDKIEINLFQVSTAVKYAGYYYLGAYLCKEKNENKFMIPISICGSIVFFVLKTIIDINTSNSILVRSFSLISGYMCSYMEVIFVYYIVKLITEKLGNTSKSKIWNRLKENSFGIYLFHQQIIYLTIIPLNGNVSPIVQVMCSFVCALGIASIITVILRKFKLTRILYGV